MLTLIPGECSQVKMRPSVGSDLVSVVIRILNALDLICVVDTLVYERFVSSQPKELRSALQLFPSNIAK